jgi:hypothetical protein
MGQTDARSRKSSIADPFAQPADRPSGPTTFFLTRSPTHPRSSSNVSDVSQAPLNPVSTLHELTDSPPSKQKQVVVAREGHPRSGSRRRSTIRPRSTEQLRQESAAGESPTLQAAAKRPSTPSPLPSQNASLPSSPKSLSSHSAHRSDDELTSDENTSQAIASTEQPMFTTANQS